MKKIFLIAVTAILTGLQGMAQDYDTFLTEMKQLEKTEKEYHAILFGKDSKYTEEEKKQTMPKMQEVRKKKVELAKAAIQANPDDGRFVDVLNFYVFNFLSIEELDQTLEHFTEKARTNPMWKSMKSYVHYKPLNKVGQQCFDFTVKGHDGKSIKLSEVLKRNKAVLIDFWASWCGPCRASMPHLKEVYAQYKDKGFEIISVSLDDKADLWEQAYSALDLPWIDGSNLLGWKDPISEQYAIRGIPHKVLVDHDGKILGIGFYRQNELEQTLDACLK
ncbi:MAG: TlpA family protein disulfide reductase [Prevotella sp.]